jgi:hypothetical protein
MQKYTVADFPRKAVFTVKYDQQIREVQKVDKKLGPSDLLDVVGEANLQLSSGRRDR